jgi:hypothetical protein
MDKRTRENEARLKEYLARQQKNTSASQSEVFSTEINRVAFLSLPEPTADNQNFAAKEKAVRGNKRCKKNQYSQPTGKNKINNVSNSTT